MTEQLYYIASLKHTSKGHEHITWWCQNKTGYTPVVGQQIGTYGHAEAMLLNDGCDCMAVPVELIQRVLAPEPYHKPGVKFYDQVGPVVLNNTPAWKILIAGSNPETKPRPRVFIGRRQSFGWKAST